ncbi:hypothetical protein ACA910_020624 [Epithemia clementina (nom. ined.)]
MDYLPRATQADLMACNGVVHVLDKVLLLPQMGGGGGGGNGDNDDDNNTGDDGDDDDDDNNTGDDDGDDDDDNNTGDDDDDDDDDNNTTDDEPPAPLPTLVELAQELGLTTVLSALNAKTGLSDVDESDDAPVTLLAPDIQAFRNFWTNSS